MDDSKETRITGGRNSLRPPELLMHPMWQEVDLFHMPKERFAQRWNMKSLLLGFEAVCSVTPSAVR